MLRRALRIVGKASAWLGIVGAIGSGVSAMSGQDLLSCGGYACVSAYLILIGFYIWSENGERASDRNQTPNQHDTTIIAEPVREFKTFELMGYRNCYRTKLDEPIGRRN